MDYQQDYQASLDNPEAYWGEQAKRVDWYEVPETIVEKTAHGTYSWFPDGELNTCYLAVDKHVNEGRGDQVALYYDSPVTDTKEAITYRQLQERVSLFAGGLKQLGVEKGDRVIIYMPMIPQAAVAMLACARLGAVHSVVFGGFAAHELAIRIDDATPKLIITASCGIEFTKQIAYKPLVDRAIRESTHKPAHTVVFQREMLTAEMTAPRDVDWNDLTADAEPVDCTPVKGNDPLYILYTSGTTGQPKGIVRDNGGHAVALAFALKEIYGMDAGDVWWGASDIGWVVGHSFIVYAPLMGGCSSVFYEGKPVRTPDAGSSWRIVEEYKVNASFCAPTAYRAIRKEDPNADLAKNYDLSSLRWMFVAGEKLDSSTYEWLKTVVDVPILDHWWQTETGWPMTSPMMGRPDPSPARLGSTNKPIPGYHICVLNDEGEKIPAQQEGHICVTLPMPPGVAWDIWEHSERYVDSYLKEFPGYYHTGDGGFIDEDGYVFITGRTDDVINVAGHRLSTGEMEEVVLSHPAVAECAVIGIHDQLKGQLPVGLIVLKAGETISNAQLQEELVAKVRDKIGAVACFREAIIVERLPKTRSGKILRATLRKIADEHEYKVPSTIDDEAILDEITAVLRDHGMIS